MPVFPVRPARRRARRASAGQDLRWRPVRPCAVPQMREPGGDGTAGPGDLAGEAAAPATFKPLANPAGAWPAIWRPPRQQQPDRFSRWRTRCRRTAERKLVAGANLVYDARSSARMTRTVTATNRVSDAEPMMQRALTITEKRFGPDHPAVARQLDILAALLLLPEQRLGPLKK